MTPTEAAKKCVEVERAIAQIIEAGRGQRELLPETQKNLDTLRREGERLWKIFEDDDDAVSIIETAREQEGF